ncbi:HIT family protein [Candidatus Berkelbacteria bacterium]|nr:HIT family protein [Candidatus Berkelbacteria bacterium]
MSCPYCTSSDIQKRKIIENDLAFAFLGKMPIVLGHTLIVPKRHVAKYENLTGEEMRAIEDLRVKILGALVQTFDAAGFNFAWNDEKLAGQSVPHFHLHIIPRKEGDAGTYEYEPRKFLYRPGERKESPEAELEEISKLIAKNL